MGWPGLEDGRYRPSAVRTSHADEQEGAYAIARPSGPYEESESCHLELFTTVFGSMN